MISSADYARNTGKTWIAKQLALGALVVALALFGTLPGFAGQNPTGAAQKSSKAKAPAKVAAAKSTTKTASKNAGPASATINTDNGKPLVMEFSAGWCVPCKVFAPVYEKVKSNFARRAEFQSLDTETAAGEKMADKLGVSGLPTVIIFDKAGKVVFKKSGIMDEKSLSTEISKAIGK